MTKEREMKNGGRVLVSDFDGDLETIGVEAVFVEMSADGKFRTKSGPDNKVLEWRYCEAFEAEVENENCYDHGDIFDVE